MQAHFVYLRQISSAINILAPLLLLYRARKNIRYFSHKCQFMLMVTHFCYGLQYLLLLNSPFEALKEVIPIAAAVITDLMVLSTPIGVENLPRENLTLKEILALTLFAPSIAYSIEPRRFVLRYLGMTYELTAIITQMFYTDEAARFNPWVCVFVAIKLIQRSIDCAYTWLVFAFAKSSLEYLLIIALISQYFWYLCLCYYIHANRRFIR